MKFLNSLGLKANPVQWLVLFAVWMVLATFTVWGLFADFTNIDLRERERLTTQARVIETAMARQLHAINLALVSVRSDLPFLTRQNNSTEAVARRLKSLSDAMPGVRTMLLLNAKGVAVGSDRQELIGRDFSARGYFQSAKAGNDPDKLYVSPPFKTVLGVYALNLVRVLRNDQGEFAGIVSATIDPEFSGVLLESVRYAPAVWASLIHGGGSVIDVAPPRADLLGINLSTPGSMFVQHLQSGRSENTYEGFVKLTQQDSLLAVRTLQPPALNMDVPLVIFIGHSLQDVYAFWRKGAVLSVSFLTLAGIVSLLVLLLSQRRQRAFNQIAAQQEAEKTRILTDLQGTERFIRSLADNIPDMFAYWDVDLRCGFSNHAYLEWFGKTQTEMQNIHIRDLLGEELFAKNEPYIQGALRAEAQSFERTLIKANGDVGYTFTQYKPYIVEGEQKGFFALATDITALRLRQEHQRVSDMALRAISQSVIIADSQANIISVNDSFVEITGYNKTEIIGKNCRFLQGLDTDPRTVTNIRNALASGSGFAGEILNYRKDGTPFWNDLTLSAVCDEAGSVTHFIGVTRDVSARIEAEKKINSLAFYDPLTKLPNRRMLLDRLQRMLASSQRHPRRGALLFIDLDNFKTLNDTRGHSQGDLLLEQVAQRLIACVREGDTVARLGGDEFVVMLDDLSHSPLEAANQTEAVGEKILEILNKDYTLTGFTHRCTPSIGITLFGEVAETVEEPLKRADMAMYQAKAAGRNTLRFFDSQIQAVMTQRSALESRLSTALAGQQFTLFYQPQINGLGEVTGAEALLRWIDPELGMVSPAEFIPVAEESGLILPLGQWVLETACAQLAAWAQQSHLAHLTVSVNVSAKQILQDDFVSHVLRALQSSGADPKRLKMEITESMLLKSIEKVIAKMTALKALGIGFSLDDFGTGYSSLAYLQRLPLDQLKIDQGFVRDILVNPNDAAISKMVIALAQSLGLDVIAEGVETAAQRDFLAGQGCMAYQGYYFGKPVAVHDFEARFLQIIDR